MVATFPAALLAPFEPLPATTGARRAPTASGAPNSAFWRPIIAPQGWQPSRPIAPPIRLVGLGRSFHIRDLYLGAHACKDVAKLLISRAANPGKGTPVAWTNEDRERARARRADCGSSTSLGEQQEWKPEAGHRLHGQGREPGAERHGEWP